MADAFELLLSIGEAASIYALVALSYMLVLRPTGIINFAVGEWALLGAFLSVSIVVTLKLPYPLAVLLVLAGVGAIAWLTERLTIRPMVERAAPLMTLILLMLAIDIVYREAAVWGYGTANQFAPMPFGSGRVEFGPFGGSTQSLLVIAATVLVFAATWYFFERTVQGKAFEAVAIDRTVASLMGINLARVTALSFFAAGAVAGLAGMLQAPLTTASYLMGLPLTIKGFSAMVIGGAGRVEGAVLGGLVLAASERIVLRYAPVPSAFAIAIPLLLLIIFLLVRPTGILKAKGAA